MKKGLGGIGLIVFVTVMAVTSILDVLFFIVLLVGAVHSGNFGGFLAYLLFGTWGVLTIGYWVGLLLASPFLAAAQRKEKLEQTGIIAKAPLEVSYIWPRATQTGWFVYSTQVDHESYFDGNIVTSERRPIPVGWHMFPHEKREAYWDGNGWTEMRPIPVGWHSPYRDENEWHWDGGGWTEMRPM